MEGIYYKGKPVDELNMEEVMEVFKVLIDSAKQLELKESIDTFLDIHRN